MSLKKCVNSRPLPDILNYASLSWPLPVATLVGFGNVWLAVAGGVALVNRMPRRPSNMAGWLLTAPIRAFGYPTKTIRNYYLVPCNI